MQRGAKKSVRRLILTSPHAVCLDRPWWSTEPLADQEAIPPQRPWRGGCDRAAPLAFEWLKRFVKRRLRQFQHIPCDHRVVEVITYRPHPSDSWHQVDLNRKPGRTWPYRRDLVHLALGGRVDRVLVIDVHSFQPGRGRIGKMASHTHPQPFFLLDHGRKETFGQPCWPTLDLIRYLGVSAYDHILFTEAGDIRQHLFEESKGNPHLVLSIEFNSTLTLRQLLYWTRRIADWMVLRFLFLR